MVSQGHDPNEQRRPSIGGMPNISVKPLRGPPPRSRRTGPIWAVTPDDAEPNGDFNKRVCWRPKRCLMRDTNRTRRRRLVSTYCAFPSCEKWLGPTSMVIGREHVCRVWRCFVREFSPLISGTWRFAVSGIAIVCRSMLGNNMNREIVSMVAAYPTAPRRSPTAMARVSPLDHGEDRRRWASVPAARLRGGRGRRIGRGAASRSRLPRAPGRAWAGSLLARDSSFVPRRFRRPEPDDPLSEERNDGRRAAPNRRLRGRSDQHRQSPQERRTEFKSRCGRLKSRRTGRCPTCVWWSDRDLLAHLSRKPLAKTPFALSSTPESEVDPSKIHSDCQIP
jgi:hypothetical protein